MTLLGKLAAGGRVAVGASHVLESVHSVASGYLSPVERIAQGRSQRTVFSLEEDLVTGDVEIGPNEVEVRPRSLRRHAPESRTVIK